MTNERRRHGSILIVQLFISASLLTMTGCATMGPVSGKYAAPAHASEVPDYNDMYYWAAHPGKKDPSDSTPAPYRDFEKDSSVDVFFIYPTSYTDDHAVDSSHLLDPTERLKWNASVNDAALNEKTDQSSILSQASAFNRYRVYAPRYRQAHFQSFFVPDSLSKEFLDTAYADVLSAFQYYLEHFNHGRPFVIAAHSQGALHAARLVRTEIEHKPLMDKLVAAYIIGMPIYASYFDQCVPCDNASQTGCFVSWRTFRKGYEPDWLTKEPYKAVVVNPLSWEMNDSLVSKRGNKGAVLFKFNKPVNNAVSAQVHDHILWTSKPHFWGSIFLTRKNYHMGDINLFWMNIRENLDVRVAAYKKEWTGNIGSR